MDTAAFDTYVCLENKEKKERSILTCFKVQSNIDSQTDKKEEKERLNQYCSDPEKTSLKRFWGLTLNYFATKHILCKSHWNCLG